MSIVELLTFFVVFPLSTPAFRALYKPFPAQGVARWAALALAGPILVMLQIGSTFMAVVSLVCFCAFGSIYAMVTGHPE